MSILLLAPHQETPIHQPLILGEKTKEQGGHKGEIARLYIIPSPRPKSSACLTLSGKETNHQNTLTANRGWEWSYWVKEVVVTAGGDGL